MVRLTRDLISVEEIEKFVFVGRKEKHVDPGINGSVFGGQLVSQSVMASQRTVPPDRHVHAIHSFFLLPGCFGHDIIYKVSIHRDGKNFNSRAVKAYQNGKLMYTAEVQFCTEKKNEKLNYQDNLPKGVARPEEFLTVSEVGRAKLELLKRKTLPQEEMQKMTNLLNYYAHLDIGVSQIIVKDVYKKKNMEKDEEIFAPGTFLIEDEKNKTNQRRHWKKAVGSLGSSPSNIEQIASLAYLCDYGLLGCVSEAIGGFKKGLPRADILKRTSLDHVMYFHDKSFDINDRWVLMENTTHVGRNNRALIIGKIWDENGKLIASFVQEGLIEMTENPTHLNKL